MATWVSKDKSKSYYGQVVTTSPSGKVVPVASSNPEAAPYIVTIDNKTMAVSEKLAEQIKGQTFYQDTSTGELYNKPEEIPQPKPIPTGTYTAAPTASQTTIKNLPDRLLDIGRKAEYKRELSSDTFKKAGYSIQAFGVGAVTGIVTPFIRPKQTALSIVQQVTHPITTIKTIGQDLITQPAATSGMLYGSFLLGKAGGQVIKGIKTAKLKADTTKTLGSGFIDYTLNPDQSIAKQTYTERVFYQGGKGYRISTTSKSRLLPQAEGYYGKGTTEFNILETKGSKPIGEYRGTGTFLETYKPLKYNADVLVGAGEYEFKIPEYKGNKNLYVKAGETTFSRLINAPDTEIRDITYIKGIKQLGSKVSTKEPFFKENVATGKFNELVTGRSYELFQKSYLTETGTEIKTGKFYNVEYGIKSKNVIRDFAPSFAKGKPPKVPKATSTNLETMFKSEGFERYKKGVGIYNQKGKAARFKPEPITTFTKSAGVATTIPSGIEFALRSELMPKQSSVPIYAGQISSRLAQKPSQRPSMKVGSYSILKPSIIPMVTPSLKPAQKPILTPKLTPVQTPQLVPQLTPALTLQLTPQLTSQLVPVLTPQITIPITPTIPFLFGGVGLPMQLFGGSKGKKLKFKPKYFASIEATAFGIRGRMPSKQSLATGLDIRPMVS